MEEELEQERLCREAYSSIVHDLDSHFWEVAGHMIYNSPQANIMYMAQSLCLALGDIDK